MIQTTLTLFFLGWIVMTVLLLIMAKIIDLYDRRTVPTAPINRLFSTPHSAGGPPRKDFQ